MTYRPQTCVWEVTMACNMRCKHCGSSCETALPGELSTEEAYKFIDMCEDIGMDWINLSGGEPFTRKDLILLVKYINKCGMGINIISNGWLITEEIVKELSKIERLRVVISLEGPDYIHDYVRKQGSFERSKQSFELLKKYGIQMGCITTVTRQNIDHLNELREYLINMGVRCWQLQIGLPMGNLSKHSDWLLKPEDMTKLVDYCYEASLDGKIDVYPADCIGYYDAKVEDILQRIYGDEYSVVWDGCNAGIRGFGILHNGDIVGCTSMRGKEFIEGNIRKKSLKEIWEDSEAFAWRRKFTADKLKGDCLKCDHNEKCLGGCANTRYTMNNTVNSENLYCTYNLKLKSKNKE